MELERAEGISGNHLALCPHLHEIVVESVLPRVPTKVSSIAGKIRGRERSSGP